MDRLAHLDQGLSDAGARKAPHPPSAPGPVAMSAPHAPLRIAVIGGGWAGLTAAVELAAAGCRVTLFEAARQLGGRARSVSLHGQTLDNGQHILVGAYRETLRLMRSVGADPEHLLRRLPLELAFPGARPKPFRLRLLRLPAPLHLAAGLLMARGAPLAGKLAAARFMRRLQADGYRLAADCSVGELLDRHGQHGALRRRLWEPLCLAALNTAPENASAQIFANVLRDSLGGGRADTDLLLPAADLDRLFVAPAAAFIRRHGGDIRLSARIERIGDDCSVAGMSFDRVVLACAPQHAVPLLAGHPATAPLAGRIAGYAYEPIATVYLAYPAEVALPFPMLGLNAGHDGELGQWAFDRGALCGTPGLIACVLSAHGDWEACDNDALAERLHRELQAALQRTLPAPRWWRTLRERRATFSCRPDLPRAAASSGRAGLWIAGDHACADYPATLEGAVRSGVAAARGCLHPEAGA